ncbi:dTMP kinase [Bradyrhizobium sp. LHD-71]|uniref:dTMP kinase n=1 Tax=Bradyrhizobium sp. LHD-71 TaxID=3072141 RepID=UPI00280E3EA0|nr:dTMP kinase [Bradyrhizobium sp. LHD-71]MDQ8730042.1 dTMP kinase [Bradyrhizobium sp. LHD-71]
MTVPSPGKRGRFITFEGGEGAGKSTQIRLLADHLSGKGVSAVVTREPGGSPGAEIVRHLVLSGVGQVLGADSEALLFAAARDDHVHNVITPALEQGLWVLCDRFTDSTRVYQGKLGSTDINLIRAMERVTIGDLKPDLTIILDVPTEVGLARAAKRRGKEAPDRFEAEDFGFHQRLRDAYRQVAVDEPERCILIDATTEVDVTAKHVWNVVQQRFVELREAHLLETNGA